MPASHRPRSYAQAWIALRSGDPEAFSALEVARRLPDGAGLRGLRRMRLIELVGPLPEPEAIAALLHHSTWFYNPHKERCTLRATADQPTPVAEGERVVLVTERGGERREPAERWWRHETGKRVQVREGVAWLLRFEPETPDAQAGALAVVRDRPHGLFCNPHSQDARVVTGSVPLPWLDGASRRRMGRAVGRASA